MFQFLKPKFVIKEELMGETTYYMVYVKHFLLSAYFYERWNTKMSATIRLKELQALY